MKVNTLNLSKWQKVLNNWGPRLTATESHRNFIDFLRVKLISGPLPLETLALIQKLNKYFSVTAICGNNDQDIIDANQGKVLKLSANANQQIQWVADQLNKAQISLLRQLPLTTTIGNYFFCHAVEKDNHTVFTPPLKKSTIQDLFSGVKTPIIICGHTHLQFHLSLNNGQELFNAGSVGMPLPTKLELNGCGLTEQKSNLRGQLLIKIWQSN